ncbi:DNA topoisomerase IB [Yoonia sp. 208BN28-4]|uniref:DNA topoisomerase IB n=1 Tax=Yoonia sp. 208BN28-4 TaxID=3126505 RepID=UPI0030A2F633
MLDLIYYPDDRPGITRIKRGRGFSYVAPDGTTIADQSERKRLASLAVPPAYESVWMCPKPNGHLQATGRDARRRKQYRYHPDWTTAQAEKKFEDLAEFGATLPRIRARVRRDLETEAGDKPFALACAVAMIDRFAMRVGHPDYTAQNGSYGALTLRRQHLTLSDTNIALRYTAKGGKRVRKQLSDRTLARRLHEIGNIDGGEVLTWLGDDGEPRSLQSSDLNAYLSEAADRDGTTAKVFRTWAGTLAAFEVAETGNASIKDMAEAAAQRLHNTATIARNSYIHPAVIDLAGEDIDSPAQATPSGLRAAERRLLQFLQDAG